MTAEAGPCGHRQKLAEDGGASRSLQGDVAWPSLSDSRAQPAGWPHSPLSLLSSTRTISLRSREGVWLTTLCTDRRMTDRASLAKMNTTAICGSPSAGTASRHLQGMQSAGTGGAQALKEPARCSKPPTKGRVGAVQNGASTRGTLCVPWWNPSHSTL